MLSILLFACLGADVVQAENFSVGVAKVDVTPNTPVRLHGFGFRRKPSEGVQQRLYARALAIGDRDPLVFIAVDSLGVPASMTDELAKRLGKLGVERDRVCIATSHTHTAPMLAGVAPTIFGMPISAEEKAAVDKYSAEFLDHLETAATLALAARKPRTLHFAVGKVGFAMNRRTKGGPVDHDLPILVVKEADGKTAAVLCNYACHCVTLSFNKVSGDWAGCAAAALEASYPGAVGLISIGCGADSNPNTGVTGDNWKAAELQGREIAAEVQRVLQNALTPLAGPVSVASEKLSLPLQNPPTKDGWEKLAARTDAVGYHAKTQLGRLAKGEKLSAEIPYEIRTWKFGDRLAMVFMPGEVVVDYALRLKRELDGHRLWINAYANASPCYIPSERILKEGGYEGGGAMIYYDLPTALAPGLENKIVGAAKKQIGPAFAATFDAARTSTKPSTPLQSLRAISVADDLVVDLVAAEPLTVDPCAIAFGPDGKLWVAEMNDYPSGANMGEPGGRIRFLEDTDRDGTFDKATTFLDGIPYPTGVTIWRTPDFARIFLPVAASPRDPIAQLGTPPKRPLSYGVLVCAAPDILYAEDTNGDGKADVVKKLYSGFATHNFHARVNSLEYGLDGWVHGSGGLFGGNIKNSLGFIVPIPGGDFRILPDKGIVNRAAGNSQQGRIRNDWDDWFGCDNTLLGSHYPLTQETMAQNPHYAPPRNQVRLPDEHAQRIYPKADLQMFALSGPVGQATAACGIGVYRDRALGDKYAGDFFTCEPVHLAVHRMKLERQGSSFVGRQPPEEKDREFLASSDPWFRPVQVRTGPDGALWVVDMYRYVIEHPMWIPPEERQRFDMRAGNSMGRIYRVRAKNQPVKPLPDVTKYSREDLAGMLYSPNGAFRDIASHMLQQLAASNPDFKFQAFPESAVAAVAEKAELPECRVQALCLLGVVNQLGEHVLQVALKDSNPAVRRHAVRLTAEKFAKELWGQKAIRAAAKDADLQVRMQAAQCMRYVPSVETSELLAELYLNAPDEFFRAAVASSFANDNLRAVIARVFDLNPTDPKAVGRLVSNAVRSRAIIDLDFLPNRPLPFAVRCAAVQEFLYDALVANRNAKPLAAELANARQVALDAKQSAEIRAAAVGLLGWLAAAKPDDERTLVELVTPKHPTELRSAALAAIGRLSTPTGAAAVIGIVKELSPRLRSEAFNALRYLPAGQAALLDAVDAKKLSVGDFDLPTKQALLAAFDTKIKARAGRTLAAATGDRQKVIDAYAAAGHGTGDAVRGKTVYAKHCAGCHKLGADGFAVGPDLSTVALKPADYLLAEILDPSRNLDARYLGYNVLLATGQTLTGLLVEETPSAVVLSCQDGKQHSLLRTDVERLVATGKSLMPEGLEQQIPVADMRDLLAFVGRQEPPAKTFHGNTPTPVVQSANGRLYLPARFAQVRGPTLVFALPAYALEYWNSPDDRATWEIEVKTAGVFDVVCEYSCSTDSAGNTLVVSGGKTPLEYKVPTTGAWSVFKKQNIGRIELPAGKRRLVMQSTPVKLKDALFDLRSVELAPVK